jgi:selenocysteine-specific elongation factor
LTLGGGRVLDPMPPRRKALWPGGLEGLSAAERIDALISRRSYGVLDDQLPVLLGLPRRMSRELIEKSGKYLLSGKNWVSRETVEQLAATVTDTLGRFHKARPSDPGMPLSELRQSLRAAPWLVNLVLTHLEKGGGVVVAEGTIRRTGFTPRVSGGNEQVDRIVGIIERAGLSPPSTAELEDATGIRDLQATLRLAARERRLEPVERNRYYAPAPLDAFVGTLVDLGQGGIITPASLRDRLGITRKFLIPLLEWADVKGITVRVGDGRKLRSGKVPDWRG